MAITKVINDLADLNLSGSTNALKGCTGTTAQQPVSSSSIDYVIVGGGGGAGGGIANSWGGGGGGAGGYLTGSTTVYHGTPTVITIGNGGDGNNVRTAPGFNGDDSGFNGIRAVGGGGGGAEGVPGTGQSAVDGGSGGGAGGSTSSGTPSYAGVGVSGQGNNGGSANTSVRSAAGGGGANSVGANPTTSLVGADGGAGVNIKTFIDYTNSTLAQIGDVIGTDVYVAGGGGGAADYQTGGIGGAGGNGGGGAGGNDGTNSGNGISGTTNTGGGGGGGNADPLTQALGGAGGSGVVILKYDNTEVSSYTLNSGDTYTVNWPADKYGVAYWPLNLNVKDVGGNYDGTATDITYVTGRCRNIGCTPDQAASFNGSTSHIDISAGLGTNGDRTRAMWINISNTPPPSSGETLYYIGDSSSNAYYESLLVREIGGSYYIRWHDRYNTIDDDILDSTTAVTTGVWYHIAIVRDGTTQKMYINGSLDNSRTNTYSIVDNRAYPLIIGGWRAASCCFYEGIIEQVRFYQSALDDTDIQDIYNNSKPGSLPPLKTSSDLTTESLSFPSGATTTAIWELNGDSIANPTTYNGVDTSMSYQAGKFGFGAYFSGSGFIKPAQQPTLSGGFSYSAWIKFTGTGLMSLIGTGGTYGNYTAGLSFWVYNGKLYLSWGDGTSEDSMSPVPSTLINTGEWVHVAATTSGTSGSYTVKAYVNGILDGEDSSTQTIDTTTYAADFTIGAKNFGCPSSCTAYYYYTGEMDQVRIYNTELTAQQIYDLWQKENDIQTYFTSGSTDTLVFKEGSGEITFKNDLPPGAEVGMLRYNNTLGQMEHFNSGGWKDFTNCSTSTCNYPTTGSLLYQFNRNTNDTCNSSNNGTPVNTPTFDSGKFGQSIVFNGSNQGVNVPSNVLPSNSTSSSSVSFWFKNLANPAAGGTGMMFNAWDGNTGNPGYALNCESAYSSYPDGSLYLVNYYLDGTASGAQGTISYQDGLWHHIAVVFDISASTLSCYVDGNSTPELSISGLTTSPVDPWANGGQIAYQVPGGPFRYFNGFIDQFRIFPSALTTSQISQLYNEIYCPNN